MTKRTLLTDQEISQIEAGASSPAPAEDPVQITVTPDPAPLSQFLQSDEATALLVQALTEAKGTPDHRAPEGSTEETLTAEAGSASVSEPTDLVGYLKAELKTSQASVLELTTKLSTVESNFSDVSAKLAECQEREPKLMQVVASAANAYRIKMGQGRVDMSSLTADALLTEFSRLETEFKQKFPVGGVTEQKVEPAASPVMAQTVQSQARLQAVKFSK